MDVPCASAGLGFAHRRMQNHTGARLNADKAGQGLLGASPVVTQYKRICEGKPENLRPVDIAQQIILRASQLMPE
jgi:hypothetical protein